MRAHLLGSFYRFVRLLHGLRSPRKRSLRGGGPIWCSQMVLLMQTTTMSGQKTKTMMKTTMKDSRWTCFLSGFLTFRMMKTHSMGSTEPDSIAPSRFPVIRTFVVKNANWVARVNERNRTFLRDTAKAQFLTVHCC